MHKILLPCRFCGTDPINELKSGDKGAAPYLIVECINCGIHMISSINNNRFPLFSEMYDTLDTLTERWNSMMEVPDGSSKED